MAEPCALERRGGAGEVVLGWRSRVGWKQKAEPQRMSRRRFRGSGSGAAKVRLRWRSRACWKDMTEPKRWMANISCQKENKSLETIVFSAETNVLRKRLKHTKKQTHYPNGGKVCFSGRKQSLPKRFVSSDKTNFAQYSFKQRFPTKQTNKTTAKKVCFVEFQTRSVEVCFKV